MISSTTNNPNRKKHGQMLQKWQAFKILLAVYYGKL